MVETLIFWDRHLHVQNDPQTMSVCLGLHKPNGKIY